MEARVVLVARAAMVRECLRALVQVDSRLAVVGELRELPSLDIWLDGHDADVAVFDPSGSGCRPDPALLDRVERSGARLVITGTLLRAEWREAGAAAALSKDASPEELRAGICQAARPVGMPNKIRREIARSAEGTWSSLTPRQREVLLLASQGRTSRDIGKALGIGARTVETHRSIGMHRLGVRSFSELLLRMAGTLISPHAA